MPASTYHAISDEELVLGLAYGAGAAMDSVYRLLRESLQHYGYELRPVHLSRYFPVVVGNPEFSRESPTSMRDLQNMGDDIRRRIQSNEALARLAAYLMAAKRTARSVPRAAWLVQSLRRPEEVAALRRLYGNRFILIGAHVPEVVRARLDEERRQRWSTVTSQRYDAEVTADIRRDEQDPTDSHGQRLRDTFSQADMFIDARSEARLQATLPRAMRLVFGEPFEPPTRDEQAMYHAFTAGLRSAEMGRQVGAAITTPDGDLVAVGANEVPSGRGGLYWSPDQPDGRDFAQQPPIDSNTLWQRRVARELLVRMAGAGMLRKHAFSTLDAEELDVSEEKLDAFLAAVKGSRFSDITEFGRAVHAEMDALTTAVRLGHGVRGCTLVTTTYPCHNCTRHLIAAGISRLIFVHPYAKSLARALHRDAVVFEPEHPDQHRDRVVFEQYVGVAPRAYAQYFDFGQTNRKDVRGSAMQGDEPGSARPRVLQDAGTFSFGGPAVPATRVAQLEQQAVEQFTEQISTIDGLELPVPAEEEDKP